MHTVAETKAFRRQAVAAGVTAAEIEALTVFLSENPAAGEVIPGTGGCRKLRVGGGGKGKRGAYRTITFYSGADFPLFLIAVFAKGERADLSQAERNALKRLTKEIVDGYRRRVVKARA